MTIDPVLTAAPPAFSDEEAAAFAREVFGIDGAATALPSERDQAFLLDGERPAVLKISNAAEDPVRLDMEALAALRVAQVDPELPVALPWRVPRTPHAPGKPAAYRAAVRGPDGATHHARLYDRLPGATVAGETLSDAEVRALVAAALDRFEAVVTPRWPALRHQVIHTDLCATNVLVDDDGRVTGILDFGDTSWSALAVDPIAVLETMVAGRDGDEAFRTARLALDGYDRVTPLEPEERAILGELLAARMCAAIVVPASRAGLYADPDALMAELRGEGVTILRLFAALGWDEVARRLGGREPGRGWAMPALAERRARVLGPALTGLSYRQPLHVVRGEGTWLVDAEGQRYLDAYNNVPVVGHTHPRVTEAIVRQARRLNTNMRYLHETALEVAERLVATTGPDLDVVMFVNTGSEANDLAWRIARAATGGSGGIATDFAYHGVTEAITALSPEDWGSRPRPDHVRTWRPPDALRGTDTALDDFDAAVAELKAAGHRPAAAILDGVLTSDGIRDLDPVLAAELVRRTHDAGALWIADEVQGGHGRTGAALWSYRRLGIAPDIVTLGKPMGNGHPVAAVITRRELAARFGAQTDFFSTFGGNPVAMAAALAVLEVIDDERIVERAGRVGEYLATRLRDVAAVTPRIGEVRGIGLAVGVEIVRPGTTEPDAATTKEIVERLRERAVLVGTTGRRENTLKIRPPLVFGRPEADLLVATLEDVLAGL